MQKIDHVTRRQFIRDYKLPIQIVEDGYFDYFLDLFEDQFKSRTRFSLLEKTIDECGGLKDFIAESKAVREQAMDFISNRESYQSFSQNKLEEFNSTFPYVINLFNQTNVGKKFVSIDLVKGNFQALNFFDKTILNDSADYEAFIRQFTDKEYFIESKQIRQVIFGKLSPKKQQKIQKFIMSKVREVLLSLDMDESAIYASSPDEIVFEYRNKQDLKNILDHEFIKSIQVHLDVFTLENIKEDCPVLIKRFEDRSVEIKNTNSKFMAETIKYLKKEPLSSYDLCFMDEGRIAQYTTPLFYKED